MRFESYHSASRLMIRVSSVWAWLPGIGTATIIALAAAFVAEHSGGPVLLYALFFGMGFYFLSAHERISPGLEFVSRTVLRVGVALLGARITFEQILGLGPFRLALVIVAVFATIGFGLVLARLLKLSNADGILTGGAVAICGASAALAISAVLPRRGDTQTMTLLTVVSVTAFSTGAMILYPAVAKLLGLSDANAGVFLGGAIHDVAQVVAAGNLVSPEAGDTAAFVKLLRVVLLVPVVAVVASIYRTPDLADHRTQLPAIPGFLIAFIFLILLNSFGVIPTALSKLAPELSRGCLLLAIAALGVKTSFQELASFGRRPLAMVAAETLFLAAFMLLGLQISGHWIHGY